jgi:two-component system sensor histidine kinase/response regulator
MLKHKLQKIIRVLTGERPVFSLEERIFHGICIITLTGLFFNIFLNYYISIPILSWLMVGGFLLVTFAYWYSRYKGGFTTGVVIYNILSNILLIANFIYNSGINGPTLLIFLLACFINISVVPKKQYWLWISLNLGITLALLVYEYTDDANIRYTYPDDESRYVDFVYTYVVLVAFISIITTYVRRSYHYEKLLVEQKASELEQANLTKNKLFSILAHDLRSPLGSIQNYLEILSEFRLDEAERISINKDLLITTQNTQQMLSNLLMWTKSQMEGVTVNLAVVNLAETLHTTLQIKTTEAQEKGIQLINGLTGSSLIIADSDMLQLIVRNLLNNAIKFSNPGGEIIISSEVIDATECRIVVQDNGIGIPHDQQAEIFSLKASSTFGTKNEKGVGLGLLLCKEFTEMQKGRIWFESTPGTGTSFYLSLRPYKGDTFMKNELEAVNGK